MKSYYILIIIFGVLTSGLIISLSFINRILNRKNKIDLLFSNIIKYVEERISLMERAKTFIEENIEEEINLANKINDSATILEEELKKNEYSEKELEKSKKLFEKYSSLINNYSKLEKNEIYKILTNENETNIERIKYAIEIYNEKVKEYNSFKNSTKINKFISKVLNLRDYQNHEK